ncbi:MAG: thioredoxin [Acutalibacter sp.]|jgi:thioredoxin 1
MAVLTITKDNFQQEVLNSQTPVLVDFWASWCGPCKMFSPIVDEFAEENEGKVKVGKINIDDEPDLAAQFRVMSIPTAMLFENGQVKEAMVGVQPKARLEALLK